MRKTKMMIHFALSAESARSRRGLHFLRNIHLLCWARVPHSRRHARGPAVPPGAVLLSHRR